VLLAVLALVPTLWGASQAVFTAAATNPSSDWTTGTVILSDDDAVGSMFSVTGLLPGDSGAKCIEVTYSGTLAATVKLFATGYTTTNALGPWLNLTIEEGSGSSFAGSGPSSCPGFTPSATIYDGTLADFAATRVSYGDGIGSFAPTGPAQSTVYRFSFSIDDAAPEATQAGTAGVTFTWEGGSEPYGGALYGWGDGEAGQTGAIDLSSNWSPAPVGTGTWSSTDAGEKHSCAVRDDATLWCWGYNASGQLGLGDESDRTSPAQVGTETTWTTVAAGEDHACALRTDGTLWCWGNNGYGQLGLGDNTERSTPVQVGSATTWRSVNAGYRHTCATRTDSTLWCWGNNAYGQLGVGDTVQRDAPVQVGTATT